MHLTVSHGALVAVIVLLLLGTLQGTLRMLAQVSEIRDQHLSRLDSEEDLHRSAWAVEIALRYGRETCAEPGGEATIRAALERARRDLGAHLQATGVDVSPELRAGVQAYLALSDQALSESTCAFLDRPASDALRTKLDEDLTNVWIRRLHHIHGEIKAREAGMRDIGVMTVAFGVGVAALAALASTVIARSTARRVTEPVARLARAATRLGEGDFSPIPEEQEPAEVGELWSDLDRLRQRLLESDRVKSAFLASVSHELRTPLGRLREALALLTDGTCGPLNERQARVGNIASRSCEREVRLVNALLDLSRLHAGEPLKRRAGCDVDKIIADAIEDERADAEEHKVTVALETRGAAPTVELDPTLLERALANLVRNAVSVSPPGGVVRVERAIEGDPTDRRTIVIDVSDAGPGLPPSVRNGMFRAFGAAPIPGSSRAPGIGIGLSLVRDVARAHGGDLKVIRSEPGGTTLRVEIPAQRHEGGA
jgi:two-component system sensor histidine kinase GlrK